MNKSKHVLNPRKQLLYLILTFAVSLTSCSKKLTEVKCSDGRVAFVSKNPERQWPSFAKERTTTIKGTVNVLDKVNLGNLDFETANQVKMLRAQLDQASSKFEIIAKTAYLGFNQDPCGAGATKYWEITSDLVKLETFALQISKEISGGNLSGGADPKRIQNLIKGLDVKALF